MAAVPRLDKRIERFVNIPEDDIQAPTTDNWHIQAASANFASHWLLKEPAQALHSTSVSKSASILQLSDLSVVYGARRRWFGQGAGFTAINKVSIEVPRGKVLGVIGESGSGKSTLAKAIVGLTPTASGTMLFDGCVLPDARSRARTHPARRQIQMVFQDPYSSLNSRRTVEAILSESLHFYGLLDQGRDARRLIASMLSLVELPQRAMLNYPHQFSGGQRQRIAIARALIARPAFLICDEPTSALDVSIQAQILNLLKDLQQSLNLSILFISHNLAVIRQMADSVVVLRHGKVVESADSESFFSAPAHQYSQSLMQNSPSVAHLQTIS
jgi:peptide/nickel transport system ATP-binding protein